MERALGDLVRDEETGLRRVTEHAIIDLDTFRRVQEAIEARRGSPRRATYEERPLLDGIARCGSCGTGMRRASSRGYLSYACGANGRGLCRKPSAIALSALDDYVTAQILDEVGEWEVMETVPVQSAPAHGELALVRAEIAECAQEFASAQPEDLGDLAGRMTKLREHETRLLREAEDSAPLYALRGTGRTYRQAWDDGGVVERREILTRVLRRVTVGRAEGRRRIDPAERVVVEWDAIPVGS